MADGDKSKDARQTLTKQDSGIFLPSTDTTPLTPYRPEFSIAANFRELAITEEMESPRVSSKPPLVRHRSLTEISPLDEASSEEDALVSAFNCRKARETQDWGEGCGHAHCERIRTQWEHLKKCALVNVTTSCSRCAEFQKLVLDHARVCMDPDCSVTLCSDAKRQLEQYRLSSLPSPTGNYNGRRLIRSSSFTMTSGVSTSTSVMPTPWGTKQQGLGLTATNDSARNMLTSSGIGMLPPGIAANPSRIKIRAAEIVNRLELEESNVPRPATLQSKPTPAATIPKASAISKQDIPFQLGGGAQGMLSPIAEQPSHEYTPTPSPLSTSPKDLSEKQLGDALEPAYLSTAQEECVEQQYPTQEILCNFNREHLTPGEDGHYLEHRNYLLNDVQPLGEGGFGTCVPGQDLRTQKMFALKRNNRSDRDKIASICSECTVLSRLCFHDNVVQFWGAVIDVDVTQPVPKVVKMMMELAENGSLADMLKDENKNPLPLPVDQSLYYLEQILQGVHFLHINGVLHLDIKAPNVLVFNNGRTVKLADFGSAMHMDDVSSVGVGSLKGCSPHYAAPEVICQRQPTFSADIWSSACVLIEMLTAKLPGCYKIERPHHSMMFLIGNYTDDDLEQLVPIQELQLDSTVVDLFRHLLRRNSRERPTALHLLQHVPCIANACEYEKYFDLEYEDEECEDEDSFQSAPTSLPQRAPPAPLECNPSNPDKVGHRTSVDSGVGSLRTDMVGIQRSSTGGSSGESGFQSPGSWGFYGGYATQRQESIREEDHCSLPVRSSSFGSCDSAYMDFNPYRRRSSSYTQSTQSHSSALASHQHTSSWSKSYDDEFHSLPASSNGSKLTDQFRCLSLDQHRNSTPQPLYHSSSAPTMSELQPRRRLSLGVPVRSESWQGERYGVPSKQTNLRRTSSEVYVDRGPDIDTPDEKKPSWLQLQQPTPTSSASSTSDEPSLPSQVSSCSSYVSAPSSIDTASSVSLDGVVTSSLYSAQEGGPNSYERAYEVKRPENEGDTKKSFRNII